MTQAIEVMNLTKTYAQFALQNISFAVPAGLVSGFIGQNGAGKTTTLKLMLGMAQKQGGGIRLLGKASGDVSVKEDLGVLFEQPYFQEDWTPADIERALRPFYSRWSSETYRGYLTRFSLDKKQKFKTLSRGMKMKLGMAATLSHDAKLLLLDEPTSGLDPVARDEMLDILREYMVEEGRSVFFSTHITSDLERVADVIVYIHRGRILYSGGKDELLERYCTVRGGAIAQLPPEKQRKVLGLREYAGGFEGLLRTEDIGGLPQAVVTEPASIDEIMVYISREGGAA